LAIIETGKAELACTPRPDMPGFQLVRDIEIQQEAKFEAFERDQAIVRQAITDGQKYYAPRP
ncbi:MAG: hypothetical protein QG656_2459, partial [Candidatus Hydrogenedentes bacterium]|nr:hypothetical protein [Candidatus Hydrogenedentota bacterium]